MINDLLHEWTTTKPAIEGDYWAWRSDMEKPQVVKVIVDWGKNWFFYNANFNGPLDEISHWIGPLLVPESPDKEKP